jgi:general secretion pathway protein I
MPGSNRHCFHAQKGFTLLEVLVALALLSIALVVVLQLFSTDMRGIAASDDYVKAVMTAESRMREITDDKEISERTWAETTNDGYQIDASVAATDSERTRDLPVSLFEISLTIRWTVGGGERALTLRTMKLVPKKI